MRFTSILKTMTVLFLTHFNICPAEAIMIWLTKQMSTLSNQSLRDFLWNCLTKNSRNFPKKMSAVEPCFLIKLQDNVSKTGLWLRLSPRDLPILEQPFCRTHMSSSSWFLYAFLVFNRVVLLCSLSELATHKNTKVQLLGKFTGKGFIGNVPF